MTLKISLKWLIVSLFLILEGILVVIFNYHNDHDRETIAFTATVLGGAFALYSYLEGIEEKRIQHAYHLIERWNNVEMLNVRLALLDVVEGRIDATKLIRNDAAVLERRSHMITALNFFEELSIAALKKSANEDRLQEFFSSIVQQSYAKLDEWIKKERSIDNEPHYYVQFECLALKWKAHQ